MKFEKLHNHPHLEEKLGLDEGHVIIDKHTFLRLLNHDSCLVYYIENELERIGIVEQKIGEDALMIKQNSFTKSIFFKKDLRPL